SGSRQFLRAIPGTILLGFLAPFIPSHRWIIFLFAVSIIGTAYALARRSSRGDLMFWLLLWASVVASAGVVFFDEGLRILVASYPLLCLFFTMGLVGPSTVTSCDEQSERALARRGGALLLAAISIFLFVPWLAHKTYVSPFNGEESSRPDEALFFGGRR